jgi:hypothetical protein
VTLKAELDPLPITTDWTTHIIPLPAPDKLNSIPGLFHFAEGSDDGTYDIFFDDIEYVSLPDGELLNVSAALDPFEPQIVVGSSSLPPNTRYQVSYKTDRIGMTVAGGHLTWDTSDVAIASVDGNGVVTGAAAGTATISGTIGTLPIGNYDARVLDGPTLAAPTPDKLEADVIASIFSDAYPNVTVNTYNKQVGGPTQLAIAELGSGQALRYTMLNFAIIETLGPNSLDLGMATTFSIDIWTLDGAEFRVKLVDFGADNTFEGPDDSEHEIPFVLDAQPGYNVGQWYTLQIPLSEFTDNGLNSLANISQIVIVGVSLDTNNDPVFGQSTFFVDNILFHR